MNQVRNTRKKINQTNEW